MTETILNIYQRLNEVRKAVAYIQKDKQVKGQGYMAVTHDAVTAAVREHLIAHGVIIVPSLVESEVKDTGTTTSSGVPIIRLEARYDIAFINAESPDDRVTVRMESHALDQGDKAPGKAISYATKYAMLKLFSIETGEQEEERTPAKGNGKILTGTITPNSGAMDNVPPERREYVNRIASTIIDCFEAGVQEDAYKTYLTVTDHEEKPGVWSLLDSKQRRALKTPDPNARLAEQA